ncbi:hypothetical protein [Paenibacillus turpanensis]|uniref:hypothetical protein n=1 Tax=Paenibacillus turpanensis TaxID=2689078 RepID=UPI00140AA2E7|nr:hypothetical protein [Paenibacillus turpanensis]
MYYPVESPKKSLLVSIVILFFCLRPIIDLEGKYDGSGINAGGIVGILAAGVILLCCYHYLKEMNGLSVVIVSSFIYLCILFTYNVFFSDNRGATIVDFSRFVVGFSPVLLLLISNFGRNLVDEKMLYKATKLLFLCTLVPIAISWLQFLGYYPYTYFDYVNNAWVGRPSGGYFQPNSLARLLIFNQILLYLMHSKGQVTLWFKNGFTGVLAITTLISTHRTSLIILVLVIVIYELYHYFIVNKTRVKMEGLVAFFLIMSIMTVGLFFAKTAVIDAFQKSIDTLSVVFNNPDVFNPKSDDFLRGRGEKYKMTFEEMGSVGWGGKLVGIGYEKFEPHNDLLRMFLVTGLLGVVLYNMILYCSLYFVWRKVNTYGRLSLIVYYLYITIYGLTLQPTGYPYFMWLFFFGLYFIQVVYKRETNQTVKEGVA